MDFPHIKGQPLLEEILPPIKNIHSDRFPRATTLQSVKVVSRAETIAKVELLTDTDVSPRSHQDADGARGMCVIVRNPGSGEIKAATELVMPSGVAVAYWSRKVYVAPSFSLSD